MTSPASDPPTGYRIATAIILLDDADRFLLLERAHDPPGWAPPGGRCEPPESPNFAVIRELREETGLSCRRFVVFNTWYGDIGARRMVGLDYVGLYVPGEVRLSAEHRASRWVTVDELRASSLPLAKGFELRFFARAIQVARQILRRLPADEDAIFTEL